MKIGIESYGVKVPNYRIRIEEIVNVWKNNDLNFLNKELNVFERAVLNSDEDIVTLAYEAIINCINNSTITEKDIDALYLGTSTAPDLLRSSAVLLLEMIGGNKTVMCSDIQFSGKSGTSALQIGYSLVKANLANNAIIVGADAINRHIPPGDQREPYAGAGAASVLIGNNNVIAEIEHIACYNSEFSDDFRPEDHRYISTGMPLNRDKLKIGMIDHSVGAAMKLFELSGTTAADYKYGVFSQTTGESAYIIGSSIGFNKEKIIDSIFANKVGDTGSASPLIGLAKVLDIAQPNDKILVIGYGAGAGADAISLKVTDKINEYRKDISYVNKEINEDNIYVSYAESIKYEYKYIRSENSLDTYL